MLTKIMIMIVYTAIAVVKQMSTSLLNNFQLIRQKYVKKKKKGNKSCYMHAMEANGGRGGLAPTHT
jgi:hypothetical protein